MFNKKYTPENITSLDQNEIFVFGSNLRGLHGGGAARMAVELFNAKWGQAVGLQGSCYAIPTKDENIETLDIDKIKIYVDEFITFASQYPEYTFFVTEIGCGLAGLTPEEVAPLFTGALQYSNIILPKRFHDVYLDIMLDYCAF